MQCVLVSYKKGILAAASVVALAQGLVGCSQDAPSTGPTATGTAVATAAASPSGSSTGSAHERASTPVSRPTPGSVKDEVSARPVVTKRPVSLEEKAAAGRRLSVRLRASDQISTKARFPGEVSGPGVAVTVEVDNKSAHLVDLGNVVVTLTDSTGAPGGVMTGPPAEPLRGSLAAGKKTTGVYVFTVPANNRRPLTIFVSPRAGKPVVSFKGSPA